MTRFTLTSSYFKIFRWLATLSVLFLFSLIAYLVLEEPLLHTASVLTGIALLDYKIIIP